MTAGDAADQPSGSPARPPVQPTPSPTAVPAVGPTPEAAAAAQKLFASRPETAGTVGLALSFGGNPMVDKLTAEHIDKSLDLAKAKEDHDFELKKLAATNEHQRSGSDRNFEVFVVVVLVAVVLFLIWTFRSQPAVLTPMITAVLSGFAGFVGGAGYGRSKALKDK